MTTSLTERMSKQIRSQFEGRLLPGSRRLPTRISKTLSFYAPDAQYLAAGRPAATTADERRRYWAEDYATPGFSSDEKTTTIEVAGAGDLAYQRGTYVLSARDGAGKPTQATGKFVVVWKKQSDRQWKAIIDIDNADQ